jgi:hypothetical protein
MRKLLLFIALAFCISTNAQITWNMGMNISTNANGNMHPRITLDRLGNPLVIWGKMSDESVYFSKWNGTMFTIPVKLNPAWMTIATASWQGPQIASFGDTVYVIVKRTPETSDTNRLFIFTSFNGGNSFNAPVQLGFIADSISRFPTVTTDAVGNPIVGFMKLNASFGEAQWVVCKSTDFGNTFSSEVKASGWSSATSVVCDCCPGGIVNSGNTVAMLYRDNNNNIRDTWAGISTNGGSSFSNGLNVDLSLWNLNACPSTGPDGIIIGDTLYSVFTNGASGTYRTLLSKTILANTSVSSNFLSANVPGLNQQNYPRIATDGNAAAIVWKQVVSGNSQLPILFTQDIANGFPTAYDTVDLDNITNADVALSNGKLFVVWQDDGSGTVKYRSGTYSQVSTGINKVTEKNYSVYPNPVTDQLNIISTDNKFFSINIFNSLGENIYSEHATSNIQLSTSNFANGLYFIQVKSDNNFFTQKFIKQ